MNRIPFVKMSGSGNDFVVIDNRRQILKGSLSTWAERLCHRQFGVGADGLLLLTKASKVRSPKSTTKSRTSDSGLRTPSFTMVYFNADGSRASMCGNGARCMAWFAHHQGVVGSTFRFKTDAYPVGAVVKGPVVQVSLADAQDFRPELVATVKGKTYRTAFLNTGVPHAVVFVPDASRVDVQGLGRALRFHRAFGPKGTNVNFVQKTGPSHLRVRTYERGVEGETLACGTGVTASAIAAALRGLVKPPVACVVTGGDTLHVRFELHPKDQDLPATAISLQGPVKVTFEGELERRDYV